MYKSPANTLFVGNNVIFVPECHSTNTLALQLSQKKKICEGTVVITADQTAGRGQRGSSWHSEAGKNLTLSVMLKPAFLPVKDQFYLTIVTALSIVDCIQRYTSKAVAIKWPNDILIAEKKCCGILIENQLQGTSIQTSIVGIGFNINQENFVLPAATSLAAATGEQFDLEAVFLVLLSSLEARYLQLRQNRQAQLKEEYYQYLFGFGEQRLFVAGNEEFEGTVLGIDDAGKLLIGRDGKTLAFGLKEIRCQF